MVVEYARLSTGHQVLEAQRDALAAAGCVQVFVDQLSGAREDRPGLAKLLEYVREGDTVVVVALDRLGRSLSGVNRTVETLTERGVLLRSLREGIEYPTLFAALAGYERELMHERAAAARAQGRRTGRPARLTVEQVRQVRAWRAGGEAIADLGVGGFGVSRATVYRARADADAGGADARAGTGGGWRVAGEAGAAGSGAGAAVPAGAARRAGATRGRSAWRPTSWSSRQGGQLAADTGRWRRRRLGGAGPGGAGVRRPAPPVRRRDDRVYAELGCSPTRYVQLLTALLDRPEAAEVGPELVARLQALRGRRQRLRGVWPRPIAVGVRSL